MKITRRQLRKIIQEFKEVPRRSAEEILELVTDLAMKMATNRGMTAEDLNHGGLQALMDEAFAEINPSEFPSRGAAVSKLSQDLDSVEAHYFGGKNEGIRTTVREASSEYGATLHQSRHYGRGEGHPTGSKRVGSGQVFADNGILIDRNGRIRFDVDSEDGSGDSYQIEGQLDKESIEDLLGLGILS